MKPNLRIMLAILVVVTFVLACSSPPSTAVPTKPAAPAATSTVAPQAKPVATSAPATAATAVPQPPAATPTAVAKIKRGGVLKLGSFVTFPSLDPHVSSLSGIGDYMMLFDPLLRYDMVQKDPPKWEFRSELATEWKIKDPTTIVMTLRKGVKFSDGSPFNAEVAKWNIDRLITHPKSTQKAVLDGIKSVDVVDEYTIQLNLKRPYAPLFIALTPSGGLVYMVSKSAVEKMGDDTFGNNPVGSGPMEFVKWVRDDQVEMKARKDYWREGADGKPLPYLDGFITEYRPDAAAAMLELRAGALDIGEEMEPKDIATVKNDPNLVYVDHPAAGRFFFAFGFNAKSGLFVNNKNLRLALQYAIDRDSMSKALGFGYTQPDYSQPWTKANLGYDDTVTKYVYNEAKAKQLLVDAGYPNGLDVNLAYINRSAELRIGDMAKSMWDKIGVRTTLDPMERLAWLDKVKGTDYQVITWRGLAGPDTGLFTKNLGSGVSGNYTGWSNKDFDKCMDEGNSVYDEKERDSIFRRCFKIAMEDGFVGGGYFLPKNWVLNKRVQGFSDQWGVTDLRAAWLQ